MRQAAQRILTLGMVALTLLAGSPTVAVAEFGQVQMGVNGMI